MSNDTTKTCTKCGQTFPLTEEYFPRHKQRASGFRPRCKTCHNASNQAYRKANPEKDRASKQKWENSPENKAKKEIYRKRYYADNREWYLEYSREHHKANREKRSAQTRAWKKANPEKVKASYNRYIAYKRSLPGTFTGRDWLNCLEYFHYCCAVCGCQLRDLFGNVKPNADHWIPISHSECPGTVPANMVCLCRDCNVKKSDKMPEQWLTEKYGARKAKIILARIQTYFESL